MRNKSLALILIGIIAISCVSLLAAKPVTAQTIPKPSVPEFTLKIVDYMAGGGLEIEIQNQAVIPNGQDTAGIFYDFRYKWHESANWHHPEPDPTKWKRQYIAEIGTTGVTRIANSPNSYYEILGSSNSHQLDFQIRAINGYLNEAVPFAPPIGIEPGDSPVIVVNTSEWSSTHTITLPDYIPQTATPNPTETPSAPNTQTTPPMLSNDFMAAITAALTVISVVLIVVVLFLIMLYKRIRKGYQLAQ
jgi:hypothetical protein